MKALRRFLRDRPGLKYTLMGFVVMSAFLFMSQVASGVSTTSPVTDETSIASSAESDTADDAESTEIVEEVAIEFAEVYFSRTHNDSEESRLQALQQFATDEFLEEERLGLEYGESHEEGDATGANWKEQQAEVTEVAEAVIESESAVVTLRVTIETRSVNGTSTEMFFHPVIYLREIDGAWKVTEVGYI